MIINADRFIEDWHENLKREIKWYINSIKAGCRPWEYHSRTYRATWRRFPERIVHRWISVSI